MAEEANPRKEGFRDHFSGHASDYSRYRPVYPEALFEWLATLVPAEARVWDCATGNGQAASSLAAHFSEVFATDASAEQIASARAHPSVSYAVRPASDSGLGDCSVGLVTVAQALHWFDLAPFLSEVERVLVPGGVLAAWCYDLFTLAPDFDGPMLELYRDIVGDDWPEERHHVSTHYREILWPWPRLAAPEIVMQSDWSLEQTLGYLRTWSATRRWKAREGRDPVALVEDRLKAAWGSEPLRRLSWPLGLLVSRVG